MKVLFGKVRDRMNECGRDDNSPRLLTLAVIPSSSEL